MSEVIQLFITDHGNSKRGIPTQRWSVDLPFALVDNPNTHSISDVEKEDLEHFKNEMIKLYSEYCVGKCTAKYDFEECDINQM